MMWELRGRCTASSDNHAKHVDHLTLMIRSQVSHMYAFIYVVPPELKHDSVLDPLIQKSSVSMA